MSNEDTLTVALAQIAPVVLDRAATIGKVVAAIDDAGQRGAGLVVFGEALVPGYPFWISRTDGARFNEPELKELHALYAQQAVVPEDGHLSAVQEAAERHGIAVVLGVVERAADRGGHSLYCSCLYIEPTGCIASVHRKLMPTYEERLSWSIGDGAGLVTHRLGPFTVGALNCWENWMPLARTALYGQGEDLHVAIWPGAQRNTIDITRFIAMESRSYVVSISGLLREEDVPAGVPLRDRMVPTAGEVMFDGGSCVAAPDGSWLLAPMGAEERVELVELDHRTILAERHNFDPSGHYARPDVLKLHVDCSRQTVVDFDGEPAQ